MAQAFGMSNAGTSSAGSSWINTLVARMPYTYKLLKNATEKNPKYELFDDLLTRPTDRVRQQSVFQSQPEGGAGALMIDKRYHEIMYADVDVDKVRRIQEYRKMAAHAEVSECLDEIADEAIVKDSEGDIVKCRFSGEMDRLVREALEKEWQTFIQIYDLDNRGWELVRRFLTEGEVYFENVISEKRPDYGIIGVVGMPTELVNPIYDNVYNQVISGFLLRKPIVNPSRNTTSQAQEELIPLDRNQVTYIHSGLWNEDNTIRLPYIENSRRAYKQLSLVEDSIIIYRLVRAPERLVFKVDVGNMPVPKAEEYVRKLMQQYWSRKNFDSSQNRTTNVYDPQSMLDAYWFTKRGQSEGTSVEQLAGGQNLGSLEDLMYFIKKLYRTLKVPQERLDPADPFKDGESITREELRFARFIIRIQQQIARGLKESFITHLKLREKSKNDPSAKSVWEKYKLREHNIVVEFNQPSSFAVMREQQIFDLKKNNFTGLASTELMSQSYCQKYYLGLTLEQMAENREWLRKDAALSWEVQQIVASGPDFRKRLAAEANVDDLEGAVGGAVPGGGSALPGGGPDEFSPDLPPEFGSAPSSGLPEGGDPAAQGATGQAPVDG